MIKRFCDGCNKELKNFNISTIRLGFGEFGLETINPHRDFIFCRKCFREKEKKIKEALK